MTIVPAGEPIITPGRFDKKIVIVTGSAQSIGECVARRVSAEGGTVLLADVSPIVHEVAEQIAVLNEDGGVVTVLGGAFLQFGGSGIERSSSVPA